MDLRQLEYFLAAVDHGGFTRGAAAVHVAQPTLSQSIGHLEHELGLELFIRTGRSVRLTAAGESVAERARRVQREVADLSALAADLTGLQVGRLDIVALATLAVDPLATLIGQMRTSHPGITIRVHEPEDAAAIDQWITSGRAALGLTDLTTGGRGLTRVELFRQEVVAVCPPNHQAGDAMTPTELAGMPLIASPVGTSTRRLLDQVLARAGSAPNIVVETDQRDAIVPLVLAGAGITLLPTELALDAHQRGARIVQLRPVVSRRIGILHRPAPPSPAAAAMINLAMHHMRTTTPCASPRLDSRDSV
jgi:LysR family transcriptional regulator, carnitine catabolism transcriptional activator